MVRVIKVSNLEGKMEKSEQWLSDGKCNICRREKYCNKPCKACNSRRDNIVRGAVTQAFVRRLTN